MNQPIVVGITGASGAVYAARLLEVLQSCGRDVHLSISPSGRDVLEHELNLTIDLERFDPESLKLSRELHYFDHQDYMAPMASGSFLSAGMVICPCSGTTLSAVASG